MMTVRALDFLSLWIEERVRRDEWPVSRRAIAADCLSAARAEGLRANEFGCLPEELGNFIFLQLRRWGSRFHQEEVATECETMGEIFLAEVAPRASFMADGIAIRRTG